MTKSQYNKTLRVLADKIAARTAQVIGLTHPPRCCRITSRRGHGGRFEFSVPAWAAANMAYFKYYCIHETCHALDFRHNSKFHAAEQAGLREYGMKPVYQKGGRGPYIDALVCVTTGERLVTVERNAAGKTTGKFI